jgi:hypothetical protein
MILSHDANINNTKNARTQTDNTSELINHWLDRVTGEKKREQEEILQRHARQQMPLDSIEPAAAERSNHPVGQRLHPFLDPG